MKVRLQFQKTAHREARPMYLYSKHENILYIMGEVWVYLLFKSRKLYRKEEYKVLCCITVEATHRKSPN